MKVITYQTKVKVMGVDILKQQLLERIEQGDEQYIRILFAVSDALDKVADQEITDEMIMSIPPSPDWKPMTKQALISELKEAMAECERGEYLTLEELEKEMETW